MENLSCHGRWRQRLRRGSGAVLALLVAAHCAAAATVEEVALAKSANRQTQLEEGAKKEGKILWYTTLIVNQAIEPVPALVKTLGLAKNSPHPRASLLFIDFLLSKDGQRILQEADYLPAHPDVPAKSADLKAGGGRFARFNFISPEMLYDKEEQWVELFEKMFFK